MDRFGIWKEKDCIESAVNTIQIQTFTLYNHVLCAAGSFEALNRSNTLHSEASETWHNKRVHFVTNVNQLRVP